jgi:hypothetical protein
MMRTGRLGRFGRRTSLVTFAIESRRRFHIGAGQDSPHHRHTCKPAGTRPRHVLGQYAADDNTRPPAGLRKNASRSLQPARCTSIPFGRSGVQRSDAPVVRCRPAFDFGIRPHRCTDDEPQWRDPARQRRRKVIGTEVHPRRPSRKRHVHPIVDEQRHAQLGDEASRQVEEHLVGCLLEPQLHRRHATAHRGLTNGDDITVGDEGIVSHQQEPECGS